MINPYQPTQELPEPPSEIRSDERLAQPYRLDWLVVAAIVSSALSAIGIILYSFNGDISSDPILASLITHSLLWIPIYRLAIPLLLPMMPNAPRQGFAVFLLSIGVLACINDFGGLYFDNFIVMQMIGFAPSLIGCILLSVAAFWVGAARSSSLSIFTRNTVAWVALVVAIQCFFFAIGRSI